MLRNSRLWNDREKNKEIGKDQRFDVYKGGKEIIARGSSPGEIFRSRTSHSRVYVIDESGHRGRNSSENAQGRGERKEQGLEVATER